MEHKDQLQQIIKVNDIVCWATGWSRGAKIGRVEKLTKKRIRIRYNYEWSNPRTKETKWYTTTILCQPERVIVINQETEKLITFNYLRQL